MKVKAAVLRETSKSLEVETLSLDSPKFNEVLVKMHVAGVCHSDLNAQQSKDTPKPMVLGHEGAGVVEQIGENVKNVKVGDKVTLSWIPFCSVCDYCINGQVYLCENAVKPIGKGLLPDGTTRLKTLDNETVFHDSCLAAFSEFVVVDEMSCVKLPDKMPLAQASLLGCGVATGYGAVVNAAKVTPGSTVAIFGCGGVGINAIQGSRIVGASKIIAIDLKQQNLEIAKNFGATHIINLQKDSIEESIKMLTNGLGVDFAIDATGNTKATYSAFENTRNGGTVVVVGYYQDEELTLPANLFHRNAKTIKGSCYGNINPLNDIKKLAQLYLDGNLMLDELILNRIPLTDINKAFDSFHDKNSMNVGRIIIDFGMN